MTCIVCNSVVGNGSRGIGNWHTIHKDTTRVHYAANCIEYNNYTIYRAAAGRAQRTRHTAAVMCVLAIE